MADLFDENRFESAIDSKISKIVNAQTDTKRYYPARVMRQDADGTWWVRIAGNDFDTPILVNKTDMSVNDVVTVIIDTEHHSTTVDGNLTSPPMSMSNAQTYFHDLVVDHLSATYAEIDYLKADYAEINRAVIEDADITNARIQNLTYESVRQSERIQANEAWIGDLTANNITTDVITANIGKIKDIEGESLSYAVGYIGDLEAENITTGDIQAATGYIHDLQSDNITTGDIQAATGYIHDLQSDNITAQDISADHATIQDLDATYAKISVLEANYADITALEAGYAHIDLANVNNAWISNGVIKNGAIGDAQIIGVSANKLTAGEIDASEINVTNLRADNLIVRRMNGQPVVGGYQLVSRKSSGYSSKNPKEQGWYELNNGQFQLTNDTAVAQNKPYYIEGDEVAFYDQEYIDNLQTQLNDRIDGQIQTYTGTVVPTTQNYPYTEWYDDSASPAVDDRMEHVGDLYYVVNAGNEADGYCYRFAYDKTKADNGEFPYMWVLIKDSDVTAALQELIDVNGDISGIKSFNVQVQSWQTNTDEEMRSVKQRTTKLETDSASLSTYVHNDIKQAIDENSATITSMSETIRHGGRNLFRNTSTLSYEGNNSSNIVLPETVGWFRWSSGATIERTDNGLKCSLAGNSASGFVIPLVQENILVPAQKYTVSFEYRGTVTTTGGIHLLCRSGGNVSLGAFTPFEVSETEWKHYEHTFACADYGSKTLYALLIPYTVNDGKWLEIKDATAQLEVGENATAWSSAPEDVTTLTNTVNTVKQTADTNLASIRQVTAKVDNLQVGGRNLLFLTRDFAQESRKTSGGYLAGVNAGFTSEVYNGLKVRSMDLTASDAASYKEFLQYTDVLTTKEDVTYTFSFYAKGSGYLRTYFYPKPSGGVDIFCVTSDGTKKEAHDGSTDHTLTSEWKRYWVKWTVPGTVHGSRHVLIRQYKGTVAHVCGLMFEESDAASNWAPAPEDGETKITGLVTKTSEITQTLDGVKTVIGYTETDGNKYSSRLNQIDETVDGHTQNLRSVEKTLGASIDAILAGENLITGTAANINNWTISAPSGASYTKTAYGTAGTKVTFSAVGGYECLYSPAIPVTSGKVYVLAVDYLVGKDYKVATNHSEYGLGVYNTTTFPGNTYDESTSTFIDKARMSNIVTPILQTATVAFKATGSNVVLCFNGGHIADNQNGLSFSFDNVKLVEAPASALATLSEDYATYKQTTTEFEATVGKVVAGMGDNLIVYNPDPQKMLDMTYTGQAKTNWPLWAHSGSENTGSKGSPFVTNYTNNTASKTYLMFTPFTPNQFRAGDVVRFEGRVANWDAALNMTPRLYFYSTDTGSNTVMYSASAIALPANAWTDISFEIKIADNADLSNSRYYVIGMSTPSNARLAVTASSKCYRVTNDVLTAETSIKSNAEAISLRATKTEVYNSTQPNLSPMFSSHNADGTYPNGGDGGFWQPSNDKTYNRSFFTALEDGWMHVEAANNAQKEFVPKRVDGLAANDRVTMLVEWRNASWTGNGASFYSRNYPNNVQLPANWTAPVNTASGEARHTYTVSSSADGAQAWNGLINWTFTAASSSTWTGDIRISFYKEVYDSNTSSYVQYSGAYKPYSGAQLYASQAELKITADGINSTVSKIGGIKHLESAITAGWSLSSIKGYATSEGTTFTVKSTTDVRVGDTVYIKGYDNTRNCNVYVKGTVKAVPSSTTITVKGEGYEDSVPVDNIISTIRQSAESVKIKANQIEIDGTTKFTNGSTVTTMGDYVSGVADDAVSSLEIGGRNLLLNSKTISGGDFGSLSSTPTDGGYSSAKYVASTNAWNGIGIALHTVLQRNDVKIGDTVTLSVWVSTSSSTAVSPGLFYLHRASTSSNTPNLNNSGSNSVALTLKSGEWVRLWCTFDVTDYALNTSKTTRFECGTAHSDYQILWSAPQLELGTFATDWKEAPEELPKPNLTPFFSFEPYNTTAGQGGQYWNSFTYPANFTAMGDGWVKYVTRDNTSGTATAYDQHRPKHINALSPDTTYTLMVEFRNVSKTGNVYLRCPDGGQTLNTASYIFINGVQATGIDLTVQNGIWYKQFRTAPTTQSNYDVFFGLCTVVGAGAKATYEMRLSLYEGVYFGPYQPYAGHAVLQEQRIYYRTTATSAPAAPTAWVTATGTANLTWTTKHMPYDSTNKYLYTTMQRKYADGTTSCGTVLLDDTTTVIDGGNIITGSIDANKIKTGSITIGYLSSSAQEALAGSGFTILWDVNQGTSYAGGEAMVCKRDPYTGQVTSNAAGWVMWNGTKRTVPNASFNPNDKYPYNRPIYLVLRLTSATATTGNVYPVWYDSAWKYGSNTDAAVSSTIAAWTWTKATDIILGKCVEPSGEAVFTECEIFDPPLTCDAVSNGVITAASANALAGTANTNAANAAKTATNYITADSSGIKIANASPSSATTYQHQTASATEFYVSGKKRTSVSGDGLNVFDANGSTSVAKFGSTARVGSEEGLNITTTGSAVEFRDGSTIVSYASTDKFFSVNSEVADALYIGKYSLRTLADGKLAIGLRR